MDAIILTKSYGRSRGIREGEVVAVETTDALINKSFRHMSLTLAEPVDADDVKRFGRCHPRGLARRRP